MMQVRWDPQLAIGHAEIDQQHQELFRRIGALLEAIGHGREPAEVCRVMDFLGDYVHLHFAAEEGLMGESGYPELPGHELEHREFIRTFVTMKTELDRRGPSPEFAAHLGAALVDWLRDHISSSDLFFGVWLSAQDAQPAARRG